MTVPPAWPTVFSTASRSTTSTSYGSSGSTSSRARSAVIHALGPGSTVRYAMPDSTADVITSVLATCAPDVAATRWPIPVHVQPHADLVGHRAGRHVERGLLAGDLGGALLQPVDGGIVAEPVVADLRVGHRLAHGGGGSGDGVRTEVDADRQPRPRQYRNIGLPSTWRIFGQVVLLVVQGVHVDPLHALARARRAARSRSCRCAGPPAVRWCPRSPGPRPSPRS